MTRLVFFVLALSGTFRIQAQTAGAVAPHAIVIGVDGLSVDGIVRAATPRLHELMERGAWTLAARGVMPTLSSPNWESAIGGAPPEQHGITSNGYLRRMVEFEPVCHDEDGRFPTIFGVLHAQHPESRIAIFHDWGGFADLVERRAPDTIKHESGASRTIDSAIEYWPRNRPALLFVHLDNVDHAGHSVGWLDPAYYQAVTEADGYIGRVLDMVTREAAWDSTYVMVTSDHGGTRKGHGRNSLAEIQIPWILAGPGVAAGQIGIAVNTYDTAPTLAWIFDLEPPQCWTGRPVLAAFQRSSVLAKTRPPAALPERVCPVPAAVETLQLAARPVEAATHALASGPKDRP
jgi:predicted AlkP superfamily pyrophosphatase or phosphodiesterase